MMSQVTFKIDSDLKEQFERFCKSTGMSMTTAFCVFTKACVRQNRIPFEIEGDPFYSKQNMDHLRASINELNTTGGMEHEVIDD